MTFLLALVLGVPALIVIAALLVGAARLVRMGLRRVWPRWGCPCYACSRARRFRFDW